MHYSLSLAHTFTAHAHTNNNHAPTSNKEDNTTTSYFREPVVNRTRCTVKSTLKASSKKFTVVIPMEEDQFGSRFGTCTCGKPAKEGIPCQHMVVVAKSSAIDDLDCIGIIPGCMTTAFWKEQYAQIVQCPAASMSDIKMNYTPDDSLRCMPES